MGGGKQDFAGRPERPFDAPQPADPGAVLRHAQTLSRLLRKGWTCMTPMERSQIRQLQQEGLGYKRIAAATGVPVNTVKTFCRRNPAPNTTPANNSPVCRCCGNPISPLPHKRAKQYCSDQCRMAWWRAHADALNRKTFYQIKCEGCGTVFSSYGNRHRKYCSRDCCCRSRRKEKAHGA